jgi:PII-like signaling protein
VTSTEHLKLTAFFGERDRTADRLLADELLDIYGRHEIRASVLLRGLEGFGAKHRLRTDRLLTLSEDLPVVCLAIDTRPRIEAVLEDVRPLANGGLLTVEGLQLLTSPPAPGSIRDDAAKLTVFIGRQERIGRVPAFVAICDLLHRHGLSGATVLLGVDGTVHGRRARARFFARNSEVPMMVISVGPAEQLAGVLPALRESLEQPLMTLERVRVCKRDGQLLSGPPIPETIPTQPAADFPAPSPPRWHKLMVHTSESARHDGRSLHREIVRRLRVTGSSGATTVRGIWGFHGDHAPHGDRLLQVHRNVPVVTTVIDSPDRIARAFEVIDELTSERGLVTSETLAAPGTSA